MPGPQLTHLAFANGIDEAQTGELVDPMGAFPVLKNGRQDFRGGYSKRLAYAAQSAARLDATSRTSGKRMFSLGPTTCVVDGHFVDIFAPTPGVNITKDRVPECLVTRNVVPWPGFNPLTTTLTYCNGYYIVCASSGSVTLKVTLFVVDATTNAIVSGPFTISSVTFYQDLPHVVSVGTTAIVVYGTGAATISARTISLANAAGINTGWSAATSLLTDSSNTGVDVHGYEDRFAVGYGNTSGGVNRLTVKTFSAALANLETLVLGTNSFSPVAVGLAGSNADTLWVAWCESTAIKIAGVDGNALAVTLASTATLHTFATNPPSVIGVGVTGTGTGRLIATEDGEFISIARSFLTNAGAVNADGAAQTWYSTQWLTRPFRIDGRNYATACFSSPAGQNAQGTHFIVDIDATASLRVVGNISPRLAQSVVEGTLQGVALVSSTKVGLAHLVSRTGGLGIGQGRAVEIAVADFASLNRFQTVPFASYAFMTGGATGYFDGHRLRESNFFVRPDPPIAGAGAGAGVTGTNLRYVAVAEKFDAQGNCEMSAPSDPSGTVSPSNDSVDVSMRTIAFSNQTDASSTDAENPIRFAVYRSGDNGALPYYRCGTVDNTTSSEFVTFSDTTTDVTASAQIYSQPGQVGAAQPRACPPGFHFVVPYGDMVVGVGDDLTTIWHSGSYLPGEGVWFADVFQRTITEDGPVTAMAVQDGTIYVFKRRSIFALSGEPPSDNGAVGGLGAHRKLASTVGAAQPPTCVSSLGIWFVSERGIELLTRGGEVQWIGEQVQSTMAAFPTVTSAVLDEEHSLVVLTLSNGSTGRDIVYDLSLRTWVSVDEKTGTGSAEFSVDACQVEVSGIRRYAWLGANGVVWYQKLASDADAHLDGSTWVTMSAETGYFKLGGVQGQQLLNRMLVLERYATDHNLSVSLSYNYETTYRAARTFTRAEINALLTAGWPVTQLKHDPHDDNQCQSVRLKLVDATPTGGTVGSGKGATWLALTLDLVPMPGVFDVPEGAV